MNASGTRPGGEPVDLVAKAYTPRRGWSRQGPREATPKALREAKAGHTEATLVGGSIGTSTWSTPTRNATVVNAAVASRASPLPHETNGANTRSPAPRPHPRGSPVLPARPPNWFGLARQAVDEVLPEIDISKPANKLDLLVERVGSSCAHGIHGRRCLEAEADVRENGGCVARRSSGSPAVGVHAIRRRDVGLGGAQRSYATRRARPRTTLRHVHIPPPPGDRRTNPCWVCTTESIMAHSPRIRDRNTPCPVQRRALQCDQSRLWCDCSKSTSTTSPQSTS